MTRQDINKIKLLVEYMVSEEVKKQIPTIKKLLIAEMKASKGNKVQTQQKQMQQKTSVTKTVNPGFKNKLLNEIFSTVDMNENIEMPVSKKEKALLNNNYGEILKKIGVNSDAPVQKTQKPSNVPKFNLQEMVQPFSDEEANFNWEDEL